MPLSIAQQKLLAFAPRVSAPLSLIGSTCIIKSTVHEIRKGTATTYHRILLAMSCCDALSSFWYALTTYPIPKGTPGVWAPSGNVALCSAQGFFIQVGLAGPVYNGCLSIYLLLISCFRWNETQTRKVEPLMHAMSLAIGLGGAILGLPLKLYNNANLWCWYAPLPMNCKDSIRYGDEANCIRGDNAWLYRYIFALGPIWASLLIAGLSMLFVYLTVLRQEKVVDRYQTDGITLRTQSRRVAWQSFWYLLAFVTTFWAASVLRILQAIPSAKGVNVFPIIVCHAILFPMQGFLNFAVYFRARFLRFQRENPRSSVRQAIWKSTFGTHDSDKSACDALTTLVGPVDSSPSQQTES